MQPGLTLVITQEIDGEEINLELDGASVVATSGRLDGGATRVTASGPVNKS